MIQTIKEVQMGAATIPVVKWDNAQITSDTIALSILCSPHSPSSISSLPTPTHACAFDASTIHAFPISSLHSFITIHKHKVIIMSDVEGTFLGVEEMWNKKIESDPECSRAYVEAKDAWWEIANQGRLRSCVMLDMLCGMAYDDSTPEFRTLEEICEEYFSEYNLLDDTDQENFLYRRGVIIYEIYQELYEFGTSTIAPYLEELLPGAIEKYGLFTETLQVRASIALEKMTRQGIHLSLSHLTPLRSSLSKQLDDLLDQIRSNPEWFDLFHKDINGDFVFAQDSVKPSMNVRKLEAYLATILEHIISSNPNQPIDPNLGKGTKFAQWAQYSALHPFLPVWVSMERIGRQCTYLTSLLEFSEKSERVNGGKQTVIHPTYKFVLRNGRASASSPNIQTTPAAPGYRELFVPSPGNVFLVVDYKCIELCTLAAVCESRYGVSILAQTIRAGTDPHSFTAAMFCDIELEEFLKLQHSSDPADRQKYETFRKHAKAFNFGIAGGEGVHGIQSHALAAYGVNLSIQQAKKFKHLLTDTIYPEISLFLYEDPIQTIARNLKVSPKRCRQSLEWADMSNGYTKKGIGRAIGIAKVVRGTPYTKDNTNYSEDFVKKIWSGLTILAKGEPELLELVQKAAALPKNTCPRCTRIIYGDMCKKCQQSIHDDTLVDPTVYVKRDKSSEDVHDILYAKLFGVPCLTLSGRMRGGVNYTQARNTPFSGLAADGAKMALWNLTHIGFRVSAFVHDEFVIELPNNPKTLESDTNLAVKVIKDSMQEFCGNVPIACTYWVGDRWSKSNPNSGVGSGISLPEPSLSDSPSSDSPSPDDIEVD